MKKINILVFPCGSEIGLELHRSLKYSTHIELYGASSVDDHGKFVYDRYFGNLPYIGEELLIDKLKRIIQEHNIDGIYPTMDSVITFLKSKEKEFSCKIISSPIDTVKICSQKSLTYKKLSRAIPTPRTFHIDEDIEYPVFIKPDEGYGTRGLYQRVDSQDQLHQLLTNKNASEFIISEYLPGKEYTVDCFTNKDGKLIYCSPRERNRVSNGISVNSIQTPDNEQLFEQLAEKINGELIFRGAWFFQVKRNTQNTLVLLEIASRIAGTSALCRGKGVNLGLLTVFDAFDYEVSILENDIKIEIDRSLNTRFSLELQFNAVYVDLDDCLVINGKVNTILIAFLYQCISDKIPITLITKHIGDLNHTLATYRISSIFDKTIHLQPNQEKHQFISLANRPIFIDDSFAERKEVAVRLKIPVFSPENIETLLR